MIRYNRPACPQGFPTQRIQEEERALALSGGKGAFPDLWSPYKVPFREAQGQGKCGWCESHTTGDTGTIDHIAPKAEVGTLRQPGAELSGLTNVRGRKIDKEHDIGYWWLAYAWDNWLFACHRCNEEWKSTLFPVQESPHPRPDPRTRYTPLLLNPYGPEDPLEHLEFDSVGQIKPRTDSDRGRASIATLGLDRESLRAARARVRSDALPWCDQLLDAATPEPAMERAWGALKGLAEASHAYAGVVRCLVLERLGLPWDELEALLGGPGLPPTAPTGSSGSAHP